MTKLTFATIALVIFPVGCDRDADSSQNCRMPFTEYSVGESLAGLELEAQSPNCGKRPFVTYIYGTCHATDDTGCAPPLEVQSWSVRHRKPSSAPGACG